MALSIYLTETTRLKTKHDGKEADSIYLAHWRCVVDFTSKQLGRHVRAVLSEREDLVFSFPQ